ncbi:MAG: FkbM family methyltransferase [Brevundimonas sp.]
MSFLRLRKVRDLILAPSLWPAAISGVLPATEHTEAFQGIEFDVVVDVGANKGQFAAFAAHRWPGAYITCFEPLPGPIRTLRRVLQGVACGRSEVRSVALGAEAGISEMHIASREDSSSMLKIGPGQEQHFGTREVNQSLIQVVRLDETYDHFGDINLLKIDVQGFEMEVLRGSVGVLTEFAGIYVECSYIELYENQALAQDVISFLSGHGFKLSGTYNSHHFNGNIVQADLLFSRTNKLELKSSPIESEMGYDG